MYKCKNCRDTGRITLLFSIVDCDCANSLNPQNHTRESSLLNGWFSQFEASRLGWFIYLDVKGNRRDVTEVSIKPVPISKHEDLKFVGIVTKWVEAVNR